MTRAGRLAAHLLVLAGGVSAQDPAMAIETIYVPITAVAAGTGRVREVLIDRGRDDGVVLGWRGTVVSVREDPDASGVEIGRTEVVALATYVARVRVTMEEPTGNGLVREGDAVAMRLRVPGLAPRSILWALARFNISFRGHGSPELYCDFRSLRSDETPERVDAILERMVRKLRASGASFAPHESMAKPLASGRYEGRTPGDIMKGATRRELLDFLNYVRTYFHNYHNRTWAIDESFAGWVVAGAPYSAEELADLLVAAKTPGAREAILREHRDQAVAAAEALLDRTSGSFNAGDSDTRRRCLVAAEQAARFLDDARLLRWHRFATGYVLSGEERRDESIAAYETALAAFRSASPPTADTRSGEAKSLSNLGLEYHKAGRLDDALAALREAEKLKEAIGADAVERIRTTYSIGDVLRDQARHREAIEAYSRAERICREHDAMHWLATVLSHRAKSLAKLGRNEEAAAVYEQVRAEQARAGDRAAEAEALEEIGSQCWTLGRYAAALEAYEAALAMRRELGEPGAIGGALQSMGRLEVNLGEYGAARAHYEEAMGTLPGRGDKALLLTDIGQLDGLVGDLDGALRRFEDALHIQREVGNRSGEAFVHRMLGQLRSSRHEYEQARAELDEAVRLYREAGARGDLAEALRMRADVHVTLEACDHAEADYRAALALSAETGEMGEEAENHLGLAWVFGFQRRFADARGEVGTALGLARDAANPLLEARCLRALGAAWGAEYEGEKALDAYRRALALFQDPREVSDTRLRIAGEIGRHGRFDDALAIAREALEQAREVGADIVVHGARLQIGATLQAKGDLVGARAEVEAARGLLPDNEWVQGETRLALASILNDLGMGAEAVAAAKRALAIYRALRNEWGIAASLNAIAHLLRHNGDLEQAQAAIAEALPLAESTGTSVAIEGTAGEIALDLGDAARALRHFERALASARERGIPWSVAETQLYVAKARRALGDFDAADLAAGGARRHFEEAGANVFLGEALREQAAIALARGRPADARAPLERAVGLARETGSPHLLWRTLQALSRADEAVGALDAAAARRREAIDVLERLRGAVGNDARAQEEFLRSRIDVYESMAELLGRRIAGETDPAKRKALVDESFQFIARARFQILKRDVDMGGGTGVKAVDDLLRGIEEAKREIARLESRLAEARAAGNRDLAAELTKLLATNVGKLDELHTNLAAEDPDDFGARVKFEPTSLDEQVHTLPPRARLVVYFVGVESLYVWVYGREGIVAWKRHAVTRAEIDSRVGRFRELIDEAVSHAGGAKGRGFGPEAEASESNPPWYRENCRAMRGVLSSLHEALITPIADEIATADPLLVMPYGWLNYLPFEALLDRDGRFLGETRRVTYLVHPKHLDKLLASLAQPAPARDDVWVGYVDPVGHLPSAQEEADEISPLFAKHEVHSQLTKTATEKDLLEHLRGDCTILHFATHGFLKGKTPSSTYLEMAPEGAYDGKLTQAEVFAKFGRSAEALKQRRLRLVVLSACETARAQDEPAAEILGMPDKFTKVGAPAVVASLWSVYTYSTSALMAEFYARLAKGTDVGTALFEARCALLADRGNGRYSHPFYWSPFILFGDWR